MAKKAKKSKVKRGRDYAVRMGRKGGKIGGKRRMVTMTPERRSEVAKAAAEARWGKKPDPMPV